MTERVWTIDSIPAFCITLERRKDRWKRFQDQPGIEGLDLKRFLGVDGKTLDFKNDGRVSVLTKRNILSNQRRSHEELDTIGGVGCALSHIALWQWIADNEHDKVLVFEDDAVVPPDFIEKTNTYIQNSPVLKNPKQWDMWLLGGIWEDFVPIPGDEEIERISAFALSHAYIMTKKCAKKMLEEAFPIHCHIDMWMSIFAFINDLKLVCSPKFKLAQAGSKTDIQKDQACHICNVPTSFNKTHKVISKTDLTIARTAEVLCVVLIGYFAYQHFIRTN